MRRRTLFTVTAPVAVAALTGAAMLTPARRDESESYADGVALAADGTVQLLRAGAGARLLPGTRVLDQAGAGSIADAAAARALGQAQRDWLSSGWQSRHYRDLVRDALLDLHTISAFGPVAAMNANWRYVWPRDASFVAAAFAATDHLDDAVDILQFLDAVQAPDGSFEARYLPDGSGPPDGRLPQTDGTGWVLWALDRVLDAAATASDLLTRFDGLLQRSTAYLHSQVANADALPAPSPDYWERHERLVTLGTAAPVLAGLEAAARLHRSPIAAAACAADAQRLRIAIVDAFGPYGYPRYPGPARRDAATAFLLPPFQPTPLPEAAIAWSASTSAMMRPAGGLAPGAGWSEVNLSWTPQTALYALAAACNGDAAQARHWLDWLDAHRTPIGALPEKVNLHGRPAGPAPLAWTAATVVLTAVALEREDDPTRR